MQFMNQKSFHPGNIHCMKKIWKAEQRFEESKAREERAKKEFEAEQEFWKNKSLLSVSKKDRELMKLKQSVSFLYMDPTEMKEVKKKSEEVDGEEEKGEKKEEKDDYEKVFESAPTDGSYTKNEGIVLHHKPFGVEVRNVKCLRCGRRGHNSGDRECPMRDQNPSEGFRRHIEDPLTIMDGLWGRKGRKEDKEDPSRHEKLAATVKRLREVGTIDVGEEDPCSKIFDGEDRIYGDAEDEDGGDDDPLRGLNEEERAWILKTYSRLAKQYEKEKRYEMKQQKKKEMRERRAEKGVKDGKERGKRTHHDEESRSRGKEKQTRRKSHREKPKEDTICDEPKSKRSKKSDVKSRR